MNGAQTRLQDERYLLLQVLGRGGMGQVIRAYDRYDQRLVALKFALDGEQVSPGHPLCREFAHGLGLAHPNLVRTLELGHARNGPYDDGRPYLVLEHIHGVRLDQAFRPGHIPPLALERVASRLLAALDHLHRAGLIHRDVCPGNVLTGVTRRGGFSAHLADLGLAAPQGVRGSIHAFSGSPAFAAPESFRDIALDGRLDLFALGLLLIFIGTGRHPFGGRNAAETLSRLMAGGAVKIERGALPERVRRLCLALTRRNRDQRPATAAEAYRLLTSRELEVIGSPTAASATVARESLRLALDRARLGARECVRLETARPASLLDELRLWCREREIVYVEWDGDPLRLLLQLDALGQRPGQSDRSELRRRFQLELIGGQLLPAPMHRPTRNELPGLASELFARLLALAEEATLVLALRPRPNGRTRALARELFTRLETQRRRAVGHGWLTVIDPTLRIGDPYGHVDLHLTSQTDRLTFSQTN